MSLPQPLAAKIKSIPMDPLALSNNIELAYMLSLAKYSVSIDSLQCNPKDSYNSGLESYNFVDFTQQTYDLLYAEAKRNYESKNLSAIKCIRNGFKDFFTRVSAITYEAALKKNQLFSLPSTSTLHLPNLDLEFKIDQIRGNNPTQWPRNLKEFHQQIRKLPWNAFSCEPEFYFSEFFDAAFIALRNTLKRIKKQEANDKILSQVGLIIEAIMLLSLKTNNQTVILSELQKIRSLQLSKILTQSQQSQIVAKLQVLAQQIIERVPVNQEQQYHAPRKLWDKGSAFMIMKKIHFQKQNGLNFFSVTNDGTYLYIYVSSINGGMYKVGTGRNGTIEGKIYLQKQVLLSVGTKLDEVNWVFCQGKLYLRTSARDPSSVEVINPDNFKSEQILQLKCPSIFGHQSLINLNRNSILLSDGQKLYFLGKQLKIKQCKEEKKAEDARITIPEEDDSKSSRKKKAKKQKVQQNSGESPSSNPEVVQRVVQFVLFEFDLNSEQKHIVGDLKTAEQLFTCFNSYFTLKQCCKALDLCENDLSEAAQWLVEQGQKQRSNKICYPTKSVIIAQSEITSNFSEKNLKGSNEIVTKQGSLLHIQNVHESIWTMDEDELTCYSESGFKIFSKSEADTHPASEHSPLVTTHVKTLEGKIQRNPEYSITYDPFNRLFYTFTWPTDGTHSFPTAVLIGSDFKNGAELKMQKKFSVGQADPKTFEQLAKWLLIRMNALDNNHCPEEGRVNHWMWYFGQKIIQLNKQISSNNEGDKKKLTNKRAKLLTKLNRVNQFYDFYHKNKQQLQSNGKVTFEIKLISPFGSDGSFENLQKVMTTFGFPFNHEDVDAIIFCLEAWLSHCPKIINQENRNQLYKLRQDLLAMRPHLKEATLSRLMKLVIDNFYDFFQDTIQRQKFIMSLEPNQVNALVESLHRATKKGRKSIIYEIRNKDLIVAKYDSKSRFEQIFLAASNVSMKQIYDSRSIGNLMVDYQDTDKKKQKDKSFLKFIEKEVLRSLVGVKLFEHIFLQALRTIVNQKIFSSYGKNLEVLFLNAFKLIQAVVKQANIELLKRLTDSINLMAQIYFASLCSFVPSNEILQCQLHILEELQKKQITALFPLMEDLQFQGISQTFEKVYETPHPIQRGKNQSFPVLKNPEASLIYADFDKRCQSDPNHDNLSIQILHENSPVGNSINCNDGVFTTNLRLTGKVDAEKPYLILGNSVSVDFSSSGHAKDAKSFGRFGFKFGLRPVFAGKVRYKKEGLQKIQKVFKSKSQFEKYINTLKLLTVCISNSIENIVHWQKEENSDQDVNKFLGGKIFKEGFQEELMVPKDPSESKCFHLDKLFNDKSKSRSDGRIALIKTLHVQNLKSEAKDQQQLHKAKQMMSTEGESIWWLQGLPSYIRSYVEKIKNFNGDFIQVFLEARNLTLPKGLYATQLRRLGFTEDMKKLWLQGEAILFLTVLKHSGLLHLNIKFSIEYIKANLKAFEEARNGIFESFIARMQLMREWRDLLDTYEGKKQGKQEMEINEKIEEQSKPEEKISGVQIKKKGMATKTIKLGNKGKNEGPRNDKGRQKKQMQEPNKQEEALKKELEKNIRERLTQDYMVKSICRLKGIEYSANETYDNVTRIIRTLEDQSKCRKRQEESVYYQPMKHLITSCIFLLKLKSPSTKQNIDDDNNLEPEEMFRSYSQDQRNVNLNKVNVFREWLENWKKWKDFKKEGKVQLKFPVSEIINFVNSWIPLAKFKDEMELRLRVAHNRIKFYEAANQLVKITTNTFLNKYALGLQVASLKLAYNSGLQSVSSRKLDELGEKYKAYSSALKVQEQRKLRKLPLKLKQIQSLVKSELDNSLEKMKLASLHLYLIECENPDIELDTALFFIPLKSVANTNHELMFIASLIVQRAFLCSHKLETVVNKLWVEIGNDSIACKRWRDLFFIERTIFLLRKLQHACRQKLEVPEKKSVAEVLFYLIYHLQVPILCKIAVRILSLLNITLKRDLSTPLSRTYKVITFNEDSQNVQEFRMQDASPYNNPELIATKCYQFFKGDSKNEIRQRMLAPFRSIGPSETKAETYTIILNMNQQEDIAWMITVLYYLEEIEKTMTPIKDWDDYILKKNKKKEHHKDKENNGGNKDLSIQQPQQVSPQKIGKKLEQRLLQNIPCRLLGINEEIEANLPVGWFFNYCNIFNDYLSRSAGPATISLQNTPNLVQKKGKNTNQASNSNATRKQWTSPQYLKLYKKFEDLTSKPLEQPKEDESEQNRNEFIKAKNFISRIRKHSTEVSTIFSNLSQNGFYVFREDVPRDRCETICQLFSLGGQYRLKQIPCDFKTKDYATKLSPAYVTPTKKSELRITCIKSEQSKRFHDIINAPSYVQTKVENNSLLYYTNLSDCQFVLEDKVHLPYESFPEVDSNEEDPKVEFSKHFIESGFSRMKRKQDQVYLKEYPKLKYFIAQGGIESGQEQCILVPAFDSELSCQKSAFNNLYAAPSNYQVVDEPEELLSKATTILKGSFGQVTAKQHIIPYMLLSCYLEKISTLDLEFLNEKILKQFEEGLSRLVKGFRAASSIQKYKEQVHVLINKLLDAENSNLSQFRLYRYDEDTINAAVHQFVDYEKIKSSLKQEKVESPTQTIESHQYPKSNYLLPIHTPIPEENKLLRYWQKNILPKIYEFVKNSLKQMEIDDFFEQMRIPLRKNDQLEAKKIAYVICDNKLPAGAVLPDANHNWNSFTIEEVAVGQDVLVRLSRSKYETPSLLMHSHNQEYRVGQVMFIDQKNFSALVRYRLPQYAIFAYSWVPVNSLEAVEESLAHYSLHSIFKQLESSLKGIIYNYSKICMGSLSKKLKINMESLIEETIIDSFRSNPISGWDDKDKWPLKSAIRSQLAEGKAGVVELTQNKFCPIKSYEIDLFSQSIVSLNKFDDNLGLVVSFKKAASLIWYSGIRFYSDEYGFKQIAKVEASKSCMNELPPLEFRIPNVYCKYYSNKEFLKAFDQGKYEQKQISAIVYAVDSSWTVSTYLANAVGQIAVEEGKYEDLLTRYNRVFLKWLQKRQAIYLCAQLCRLVIRNSLRIRRIYSAKEKAVTMETMGTSEEQVKSFLEWIAALKEAEDKEMIVLYSPLLQNLIEMVGCLLGGMDKPIQLALSLPAHIQQTIKIIQMTAEIEKDLMGKRSRKIAVSNDTQWERILLIEKIPDYIGQQQLVEKVKTVLTKNNAKVLAPAFDIFHSGGSLVILVDSWDITELVEEEVMEKIENQEEKEAEPDNDQGLLMEWECQVCTFINPAGTPDCGMCAAQAPAPKAQLVYEKVESKDVNQTQIKLKQKEMKRFENVKEQIKLFIGQQWKKECSRIGKLKQSQEKNKEEEKRRKRVKKIEAEQKIIEKPNEPAIQFQSGSQVLDRKIVQQFLKKRFDNLPKSICEKVSNDQPTYLSRFKQLARLGFDLWGDNIASQSPSILSLEYLSQLMQYVQDQICKGSSSVLSYNEASIRLVNQVPLVKYDQEEPLNFTAENNAGVKAKYSNLAQQKSYNIRYSWKVIKQLNASVSKCLSFVNMKSMSDEGKGISSISTMGANLKSLRQLIMGALKLQLFQKIMQRTSAVLEPQEIPKINLERLKIKDEGGRSSKLISSKDRDDFLFTKAFEQLEKVSSIHMRPFKPKGTDPYLSFAVNFKGELVQGEAGPYRQFFTDISNQLHPESGLNLFIKTPNNAHKIGEGRSKWTVNPKANSTYYLSLFHFLGRIMGCCIRTGCHLPIDLASFCWKLIADERMKQADMSELDQQFWQQNKQLISCPSQSTFDSMEDTIGQSVTWVYTSINGQVHELVPNGKNERVCYQDRKKYVEAAERMRIEEVALQIGKIREGLSEMLPDTFLNYLSGDQLKTMVCGVPKVDVQLLKKHTKYAGGLTEESPVIKYFWEMMKEFSQEERLKLIRFCWGQERLPLNSEQFQRNGVRFMIKPMLNKQNPDQALPKADTCFFNIELPQYSSKQTMKKRILLAINLDSVSINGDRDMQPDDNPLMGNVDYEDDGEGEEDEEGGGGGGG